SLTGSLLNAGHVVLNPSPGLLTITGDYTQTSSGALRVQITGATAGTQFDQLRIGGSALLAGRLDLALGGGFQPGLGDTFPVLNFTARSGQFATVTGQELGGNLAFGLVYHAADLTLVAGSKNTLRATSSVPDHTNLTVAAIALTLTAPVVPADAQQSSAYT